MSKHGNLQKYENPNPVQRWLLGCFLRQAATLTGRLGVTSVLDAGCAEGFVSRYLRERWPAPATFWGVDVDERALARGKSLAPWLSRAKASVLALPFAEDQFDLVLCTEVLEHLAEPLVALRELRRVSRRYVLLSVPHEPWFRSLNFLRGKHIRNWGNDPEHLQLWGYHEFAEFVSGELKILQQVRAFPWLVLLCSKQA